MQFASDKYSNFTKFPILFYPKISSMGAYITIDVAKEKHSGTILGSQNSLSFSHLLNTANQV